jgi:hypothetical protein
VICFSGPAQLTGYSHIINEPFLRDETGSVLVAHVAAGIARDQPSLYISNSWYEHATPMEGSPSKPTMRELFIRCFPYVGGGMLIVKTDLW